MGEREERTDGGESEAGRWAGRVLLGFALALVAFWVIHHTTWYLAIDQFGYLTFARDLAQGRVEHQWEILPVLARWVRPDVEIDVLAQTYVRRGDALFCRYAPGFPLLLAATSRLFGEAAMHYTGVAAIVALLACIYGLTRRAIGSEWAALAAVLIVMLLPNHVLLWSITPLRDLPAHFFSLFALGLLVSRHAGSRPSVTGLAGLSLGYAMSTRADAVLYLVPAVALMRLDGRVSRSRILAGAVGLLAGASPLLVYNAISTGNPLRPTQAMEIEDALSRAAPQGLDALIHTALFSAHVALASEPDARPEQPVAGTPGAASQPATPSSLAEPQVHRLVQGGGLRLSHLPQTLPRNLAELRKSFGDLAVVCGLVGALAVLTRPLVFWLTIPYSVLALLVFSCWVRPDPRYLTGVTLLFSILVVEGVRVIAALPAAPAFRAARWRPFAAAAIVLVVTFVLLSGLDLMATDALPSVTLVLALALGLGLLRAAMQLDPGRARLAAAQVMAVGLSVVLVWRSSASWGVRASFQAPEVERARATLARALEPRAVVITSTDIGRPAENIDYYTDARAIYTGELRRWFTRVPNAAWFLARAGFAPYLLLPPSKVEEVMAMRGFKRALNAEVVAEIPPERAVDYFVASPFHRGVALELVRLTPRKRLKQRASP